MVFLFVTEDKGKNNLWKKFSKYQMLAKAYKNNRVAPTVVEAILTFIYSSLFTIYFTKLIENITNEGFSYAIKNMDDFNILLVFGIVFFFIYILMLKHIKIFHVFSKEKQEDAKNFLQIIVTLIGIVTNCKDVRGKVIFHYKKHFYSIGLSANHTNEEISCYSDHGLKCFRAFDDDRIMIENLSEEEKHASSNPNIKAIVAIPIHGSSPVRKKMGVLVIDLGKTSEQCHLTGQPAELGLDGIAGYLSSILGW